MHKYVANEQTTKQRALSLNPPTNQTQISNLSGSARLLRLLRPLPLSLSGHPVRLVLAVRNNNVRDQHHVCGYRGRGACVCGVPCVLH